MVTERRSDAGRMDHLGVVDENDEHSARPERSTRASAIEALNAMARHISTDGDLTSFYTGLTASVAELVGADRVLFWQVNADGTLTAIPGAYGVDEDFMARLYPVECSPDGDDLPSRVVYGDLTFMARRGEGFAHQDVLDVLRVSSAISVPWRAGDQRLGVVAAYDSRRPTGFSNEDAWLLRITGLAAGLVWQMNKTQAGIIDALKRLQRADLARQLLLKNLSGAVDKARRRFAGELHDDALQKLTAAELHLQRAREALGEAAVPEAMEQASSLLQQAEEALRRLLLDVQPPALEMPGGLASALRDRLAVLQALTGTVTTVELELPEELPYELNAVVFREVGEALSNVEKHAAATRVAVSLKTKDGGIQGTITDDGRGFVVAERNMLPGHLGLLALNERAQMAGGWCTVASEPGAGTTVDFWIPLPG